MGWNAWLEVTATAPGGTTDRASGGYVSGGPRRTVYAGYALQQEHGESRPRLASGLQYIQADATFITPRVPERYNIEPGHAVRARYLDSDRTADGEVKSTSPHDCSLTVVYR